MALHSCTLQGAERETELSIMNDFLVESQSVGFGCDQAYSIINLSPLMLNILGAIFSSFECFMFCDRPAHFPNTHVLPHIVTYMYIYESGCQPLTLKYQHTYDVDLIIVRTGFGSVSFHQRCQ